MCEDIQQSQIVELDKQIATHLQSVQDAMQHNEFIDLALVEQIANVLIQLLKEMGKLPRKQAPVDRRSSPLFHSTPRCTG